MDTWIISDDDDLIDRIRQTLQLLDIPCPSSRVVSLSAADAITAATAERGTIFLAVESVTGDEVGLVRRIRSSCNANLAVVSKPADYSTVLKIIRAGADDFLSADGDLATEITGFVARVALEHSQLTPKGSLISIVPCHAPSDASALAVNMSAVIAKRAGSCCLLDLQLRGGDAALLLNLTPRHTVYDLLTQSHHVDKAMLEQALTRHESGINVLAGPELFSNLQNIQPRICQEILSVAQATHPFVVVISEDIQHAEQLRALASSDRVVLTIRLDIVSIYRAQRHVEFLTRNNISTDLINVVAMSTGHAGELPLTEAKKVLRIPTIHCIPDDPQALTVSINVGNPMVLDVPRSKASRAIIDFVESLTCWNEANSPVAKKQSQSVVKAATAAAINLISLCK